MNEGTSRTILVVDEELQESQSLRPALRKRRLGLDVVLSRTADEAWSLLRERPFDVLVLDLPGPGHSGLKLLELMAQKGMLEAVPVVILAREDDDEARSKAMAIGAGDVVGKPVDLSELVDRIKIVLKNARSAGKRPEPDFEEALARRTAELDRSRLALVIRLAKVAEMRDESTGNHVVRVGCFSEEIAARLGLGPDLRKRLLLAAPMHDLGKLAVPESILTKPSPLNQEEWVVMRGHCEHGAKMLHEEPMVLARVMARGPHFADLDIGPDPILSTAAEIALNHHERWDGKGYPRGIAGESIPLEARIVALADAFDALTSARPWRCAVPENVALEVMMADQGSHFDPEVFDAFVECFPRIKAIRRALSDTGDE